MTVKGLDYNLKNHKNLILIEEWIRLSDGVSLLTLKKQAESYFYVVKFIFGFN